jgi:DNA-binding response OmpR family regulator
MRMLVAEDDRMSSQLLERNLTRWGHEVVLTSDGLQAWNVLSSDDGPRVAILDWMMPGIDGVEICRRVRQANAVLPIYIILLTAKGQKTDIVEGLIAGANDYVIKPFNREELQARIQVGVTVVELQQRLADRVIELEEALAHVKLLQGKPQYLSAVL